MKKLFKFAFMAALGLTTSAALAQNVDVTATAGTISATYATLKDAVDAVNAGTHQGAVQVMFVNNTTETATSLLNASGNGAASYTSVLVGVSSSASSLPVTVTSNIASGRVLDIGGSNVTVDGRVNQTGTTRSLVFSLTQTTSSGIRVIAASGFPIGNTNLRYFRVSGLGVTHLGSGVFLGTSAQAAKDSNLVADGVMVTGVNGGIIVGSAARPNITKNATIQNCIVENTLGTSIDVNTNGSAEGTLTAEHNIVRHVSYNNTVNAAVFGISMGGSSQHNSVNNVNTVNIRNNSVENIMADPSTGSPAVRGINVTYNPWNNGAGAHLLNVSNNNVRLNTNTTTRGALVIGIVVSNGGFAAGGLGSTAANDARGTFNVVFNTVQIGGTSASGGVTGTTSLSRGVVFGGMSTDQIFNHFNNIYIISRTGGNTRHMWGQFSIPGLDAFNDYVNPPAGFQFNSNNNIYSKAATSNACIISGPFAGGFIFPATSTVATLSAELGDAYNNNSDDKSSEVLVTFPSVTSPEFSASFDKDTRFIGVPVAGVTTDFDGTTRDASFPYRGAHEGSAFPNDLSVGTIYTLGRIPYPYAFPHGISANVANQGVFNTTGITATLTITGANTITKTVNVPDLTPGQTTRITFPDILESEIVNTSGTHTVTVSIDQTDDIPANNSGSMIQDLSVNTYSLGYRVPPALNPVPNGGVGFNGATGDFVAKFLCSSPSEVNQARVYFNATGGINYQILIFADDNTTTPGAPGTLLYTSPTYSSVNAATAFDTKQISPGVPVNGNFFIGLRQLGNTNLSFAYQNEAPPRAGSFFFASPQGSTTWNDFATTNSPFRFLIEPRLRAAVDLAALTVASPLPNGCYVGATPLTVTVENPGNTDADFSVNPLTINVSQLGPNGVINYSTTVTSGTLAKDASQTFTVSSVPQVNLGNNGTYQFTASIVWGPDLIADNNTSPVRSFVVSRAASYPVNTDFTPTGVTANSRPIDRIALSGGLNWNFSASQGSPFLAPVEGTGVLEAAMFNNASAGATARVQLPCLTMPVANFPVLQFYMSQDPFLGDGTEEDSLRVMLSTDGGNTYAFHSNYARFNPGGTGWRTVKVNLPNVANLRIALDAKRGNSGTARNISVHAIQIYDCGTGGLWLGSNNDWFTGTNWCSGTVPDATTDVVVGQYAGVSVPTITGAVAQAKNVTVQNSGRSLVLANDPAAGLLVNGNLTVTNNASMTDNGAGQGVTVVGGSVSLPVNTSLTVNKFFAGGLVTLNAGGSLRVRELLKINAASTLINNSSITLLSDTANGTANFGEVDGSSIFLGNLSVQRSISRRSALSSGSYHQVASPVQGNTVGSFTAGSNIPQIAVRYTPFILNGDTFRENIWKYNPLAAPSTSQGWEVPNASDPFAPGAAVRLWFRDRFWSVSSDGRPRALYTHTGTPYIGNISIPVSFCPGGCTYTGVDPNGYNLVGNPYASAIDWNTVSVASSNLDNAIWAWNPELGAYGSFVAGTPLNGQTNIIPSGAGFFVRANGAGASVNVSESAKSLNTTTRFLRAMAQSRFYVKMAGANLSDETAVRFDAQATAGFDRTLDAGKFEGSMLNISTMPVAGQKMGINSMPEPTNVMQDLPMSVSAHVDGNYTLTFDRFEGLDANLSMLLKDNFTNTVTPITAGMTYSFSIARNNPATFGDRRFVITYGKSVTNLASNLNAKPVMTVYPNPSVAGAELNLSVANISSQNAVVVVRDVVGRQVFSTTMNVVGTDAQVKQLNAGLKPGVYTVSVEGSFGRISERVTIQ